MREKISNFFRNINPVILVLLFIMLAESIMENNMSVGQWFYTKLLILPGMHHRTFFPRSRTCLDFLQAGRSNTEAAGKGNAESVSTY